VLTEEAWEPSLLSTLSFEQIELLTGNEEVSAGALLLERRRVSMNRSEFGGFDGTTLVDGLTDNINDSSKSLWADRDHDGVTRVDNFLTSDEALRGVESDGAHIVSAQVLRHLQDKTVFGALNFESVQNRGQCALELHVHNSANNLGNFSICLKRGSETTYIHSQSDLQLDPSNRKERKLTVSNQLRKHS